MADNIIKTVILLHRGTKEAWERNNPILLVGEPGFSIDENILKVGDGNTRWNDLPIVNGTQEIRDIIGDIGEVPEGETIISLINNKVDVGDVYTKAEMEDFPVSIDNLYVPDGTELVLSSN